MCAFVRSFVACCVFVFVRARVRFFFISHFRFTLLVRVLVQRSEPSIFLVLYEYEYANVWYDAGTVLTSVISSITRYDDRTIRG